MRGLGHNQPSLDSVVEENLLRGLYLSQVDALVRCINDPRLAQRHRLVLAQIVQRTNAKTGLAYPGRARLAADIIFYANGTTSHYSERTIGTTIHELIEMGYLVAVRRAPEGGGRALSHYAVTKPSIEELQAKITAYCEEIRNQAKREFPRPDDKERVVDKVGVAITTDDNPMVAVKRPDDNPWVVDKAGVDDNPVVAADDNPVGATVTGKRTGSKGGSAPDARSVMNAAFGGEAAFAERNIIVTPSGALLIGQEFREELRKTYTDRQIDGALDCTLAACGSRRDKLAILSQIRRQCVFRKDDAAKTAARPQPSGYTKAVIR